MHPPRTRRPILALVLLLLAAPSRAQQAPAAEPEVQVAEVGSRAAGGSASVPVTVIGADQIRASGAVSVGRFLQTLTGQGNAGNVQYVSGGDGTNRVNLRSLDQGLTLVLLNGRRLPGGGSSVRGAADLDAVPAALVERIEILEAGGSSIHGQDAVGGVVNIVTRSRADATQVSLQIGTSTGGGGLTTDLLASTGAAGDRGHVLLSLGFFDQQGILRSERSWAERIYSLDYRTGARRYAGNSATPAGTFSLDPSTCTTAACNQLSALFGAGDRLWSVAPGSPGGARPYVAASDAYDFNGAYHLVSPSRRTSLFASGDARLGGLARAFFEASHVNRQARQGRSPGSLFTIGTLGTVVSGQSIYNPYGADLVDVRRRLVELGPVESRQEMGTLRAVLGLDGTLPAELGPLAGVRWEVAYLHGRSQGLESTSGLTRPSRYQAALGPSFYAGPGNTRPTCGTPGPDGIGGTADDVVVAGCVPVNLLGGAGSLAPEMAASLGFTGADRYVNAIDSLQANLGAEIFRLAPDRPARLAVGYEHRRTSGSYRPDPLAVAGDTSSSVGQAVTGAYTADEGFAELVVPLLAGRPLAEELEVRLAGRLFRYDSFGSGSTYDLGLSWSPIRGLGLRASRATAFSAPTVPDLYLAPQDSFPSLSDPCSAAPVGSALDQRCRATGVPAGGSGDLRTALRAVGGGNPGLEAPTARITSAGLTVAPPQVPGLMLALDYVDIRVSGTVEALGAAFILDSCYLGASAAHCERIHRNASGLIDRIDDTLANAGSTRTSAVDLAARYALPTPAGRFDLHLAGTWLLEYRRTAGDGTATAREGTFDGLLALPAWKLNAGLGWQRGGLGAALLARYVGSYRECSTLTGQSGQTGLCSTSGLSHTVSSSTTVDASVSYQLRTALGGTTVALGVTNAFDARPPIAYNLGTYSADPSTYDFAGRFVYARLAHAY